MKTGYVMGITIVVIARMKGIAPKKNVTRMNSNVLTINVSGHLGCVMMMMTAAMDLMKMIVGRKRVTQILMY